MKDYNYPMISDPTNFLLVWSLFAILIAVIGGIIYLCRYAKTENGKDMSKWRKRVGWPLCEVLTLAATILSLFIGRELSQFHFGFAFLFFFLGAVALLSFIFCFGYFDALNEISRNKAKDKAKASAQAKNKEIRDAKLAELNGKYGEPTAIVKYGSWHNIHDYFIVYEESQLVIINLSEYRFSDIMGFNMVDDITRETITVSSGTAKTSTGSMLGRAVVGGVLTGGLGAVAGAVTAKKNISVEGESMTSTRHNYIIYININNMKDPIISLKIGEYQNIAHKIAGLLNVIVEKNRKSE